MSPIHDEIRVALARAGNGLTARQLLAACDSAEDVQEVVKQVHILKTDGKVKADGMRDSQVVYKLGEWAANGKGGQEKILEKPVVSAPIKAKRTVAGLREGLFEMLEKLSTGKVENATAKTYAHTAMTILKSLEVQLEYERMRVSKEIPVSLDDVMLVPMLDSK